MIHKEGNREAVGGHVKVTEAGVLASLLICTGAHMLALWLERVGLAVSYLQGLSVGAVLASISLAMKAVVVTRYQPHKSRRFLRAVSIGVLCVGLPYVVNLARQVALTVAVEGGWQDPYGFFVSCQPPDGAFVVEEALSVFIQLLTTIAGALVAIAAFGWSGELSTRHVAVQVADQQSAGPASEPTSPGGAL